MKGHVMETLHFTITINATKEKVWNTMLGEQTYRQWTAVFMPGSHYVGDWSQGSKIHFLGPVENGGIGGMVSRIKENRPWEFMSIEHLGFIRDGTEDTSGEAAQKWAGALENYTFKEKRDATEVHIATDTSDEYREMFLETWPKALQKLKELAEK
jgi:uncharacterized protein YndB with AHSA1/START domain